MRARPIGRGEARGREPRQCRFESDRAYQFAPVAQSGRGAALRTRRFAVRVRAGVPMEGAARWLATGPENQGDRKGQGFDSSAFRQSGARKQTGALRPVANRIEPSGFRFEYGPLRQPHSFNGRKRLW
jgi:hypothetical protein